MNPLLSTAASVVRLDAGPRRDRAVGRRAARAVGDRRGDGLHRAVDRQGERDQHRRFAADAVLRAVDPAWPTRAGRRGPAGGGGGRDREFERRLKSPSLMAGHPATTAPTPCTAPTRASSIDWEQRIKPLARAAVDDEADARRVPCGGPRRSSARSTSSCGRSRPTSRAVSRSCGCCSAIGFFVMMMLVVAALFLLNVEVFQPIARLAEAAKRVRTGDFQRPRGEHRPGRDRPARPGVQLHGRRPGAAVRLAREAGRREDARPRTSQRVAGAAVRNHADAGREAGRCGIADAGAVDGAARHSASKAARSVRSTATARAACRSRATRRLVQGVPWASTAASAPMADDVTWRTEPGEVAASGASSAFPWSKAAWPTA